MLAGAGRASCSLGARPAEPRTSMSLKEELKQKTGRWWPWLTLPVRVLRVLFGAIRDLPRMLRWDRVRATRRFYAECRRRLVLDRDGDRLAVAVDVTPYWEKLTGVGWYLHQLLSHLASEDSVRLYLYGPTVFLDAGDPPPAVELPVGPVAANDGDRGAARRPLPERAGPRAAAARAPAGRPPAARRRVRAELPGAGEAAALARRAGGDGARPRRSPRGVEPRRSHARGARARPRSEPRARRGGDHSVARGGRTSWWRRDWRRRRR